MFTSHFSAVVFLALALLFENGENFAQAAYPASIVIRNSTVASLIQGLNTNNDGLQSSCAFWLGEYRISEVVILLQKILRNDDCEGVRISSALALFKINTPIAINSVKQAIRFDESERVQRMANLFYSAYLKKTDQNNTDSEGNGWLAKTN
jgi:hypothetical protein